MCRDIDRGIHMFTHMHIYVQAHVALFLAHTHTYTSSYTHIYMSSYKYICKHVSCLHVDKRHVALSLTYTLARMWTHFLFSQTQNTHISRPTLYTSFIHFHILVKDRQELTKLSEVFFCGCKDPMASALVPLSPFQGLILHLSVDTSLREGTL